MDIANNFDNNARKQIHSKVLNVQQQSKFISKWINDELTSAQDLSNMLGTAKSSLLNSPNN